MQPSQLLAIPPLRSLWDPAVPPLGGGSSWISVLHPPLIPTAAGVALRHARPTLPAHSLPPSLLSPTLDPLTCPSLHPCLPLPSSSPALCPPLSCSGL